MDKVQDVDIPQLKMKPEFVMYIAEVIENEVPVTKEKSMKLDKKEIFEGIMLKLHLTQEQCADAVLILEFLLENKMVKKTPLKKLLWHVVKKHLLSAVLLK